MNSNSSSETAMSVASPTLLVPGDTSQSIPTIVLPYHQYTAFLSGLNAATPVSTPAAAALAVPTSSPSEDNIAAIQTTPPVVHPPQTSPPVNIPTVTKDGGTILPLVSLAVTDGNHDGRDTRLPSPPSVSPATSRPPPPPSLLEHTESVSTPSHSKEPVSVDHAVLESSPSDLSATAPEITTSHSAENPSHKMAPITVFGLATGSIIAVIVSVSVILLFCCRRRRRRLRETNHTNRSSISSMSDISDPTAAEMTSEAKQEPQIEKSCLTIPPSSLKSSNSTASPPSTKNGRHITWQDQVLGFSPPHLPPPPLPPRARPPLPRNLMPAQGVPPAYRQSGLSSTSREIARRSISLPNMVNGMDPNNRASYIMGFSEDDENDVPNRDLGSPGRVTSSYYGSSHSGDNSSRKSALSLYTYVNSRGLRRAFSDTFTEDGQARRSSSIRSSGLVISHQPSFMSDKKRYSATIVEELSSASSTGTSILNYNTSRKNSEQLMDLENSSPISEIFENSPAAGGLMSPSHHKSSVPLDSDDYLDIEESSTPTRMTGIKRSPVTIGGVFVDSGPSKIQKGVRDSQDVFVDHEDSDVHWDGNRHFSCSLPTLPRQTINSPSPSPSPPHIDDCVGSIRLPSSSPPDSPTLPRIHIPGPSTPESENSDPFSFESRRSSQISPKTLDLVFRKRATGRESVYSPTLAMYQYYSSPDLDVDKRTTTFLLPLSGQTSPLHRHSKSWTSSSASVIENHENGARPFSAEFSHHEPERRSSLFYPWAGFVAKPFK